MSDVFATLCVRCSRGLFFLVLVASLASPSSFSDDDDSDDEDDEDDEVDDDDDDDEDDDDDDRLKAGVLDDVAAVFVDDLAWTDDGTVGC